jgi:hypothetical protein
VSPGLPGFSPMAEKTRISGRTAWSAVDESFLIENGSDAHFQFSKPDESITEAGWFGRLVRMNASN